jgi:hypothetical protein
MKKMIIKKYYDQLPFIAQNKQKYKKDLTNRELIEKFKNILSTAMIQTNSTANMLLLGLTNQMKIRHQDKKKGVRVPKLASQTYNMTEEDAMERIKSKENKKLEDARKKEANKKEREEKKKEAQKNKELASETRKKDMEIRRKDREEAMKNKPKHQYEKRKVEVSQEEVGVV